MVKSKWLRLLAALVTVVIALGMGALLPSMKASAATLSKSYKLTGVGASDMVAVVKAQNGKMQSELGYSKLWQVDFLADCAALAGQSAAIPKPATAGEDDIAGFLSSVKKAGGKVVSSPKAGDLVFHYCNTCKRYSNVGLYISNDELYGIIAGQRIIGYHQDSLTGFYIYSYGVLGVVGGVFYEFNLLNSQFHLSTNGGGTITYVRPNYSNKLTGLSVSSKPTKTSYYIGDTLNTSGLALKATYAGGSTKTITSGYKTSYDFSSSGTKKVTVTYGGLSTSFNVTVSNVTVSSIAVSANPTKTVYNVGEKLNTSGLKLKVTYSNGTTSTITSGFTTSYDFSSAGTKKVTVTYSKKSTSFNVTVNAVLSSISVETNPIQTTYTVGSSFSSIGLTLKATYNDGSTKTITSGFTTSYDFSGPGKKTVTINYGGKSTGLTVTVNGIFSGSGTQADPYQIATADDLVKLSNVMNDAAKNPLYTNCYYIQTADISMYGVSFAPIGTYAVTGGGYSSNIMFNGKYNGNYHQIKNLSIQKNANYAGLFGHVHKDAVIENLSVSGNVKNAAWAAGGIAGELGQGGVIQNCSFHGSVTAVGCVGSIVGNIYGGGSIINCYSNAVLTCTGTDSDATAGGIVGIAQTGNDEYSTNLQFKNCYFAGTITGVTVGGFVSQIFHAGKNTSNAVILENNYYLDSVAPTAGAISVSGSCTALSDVNLKACADSLGSPYVDNADENTNDGYPVFEWQATPYTFLGSGTEEDPYQISSKEDLEAMRDLVNNTYFNPIYGHAYYKQTADITLAKNEPWTPIGLGYDGEDGLGDYNCTTRMFFGQYDGNMHTIENLVVNQNWKDAGLFGVIRENNACVKNLVVVGTVDTQESTVGIAGGIAGAVHYGATISGCAFIGNVTGYCLAGGIAGNIYAGGSISDCYQTGNVVSNSSFAGGIVGQAHFGKYNSDGDSAVIQNCYHANGTVTGTQSSSAIVGSCYYYDGIDNTVNISNCYAAKSSCDTITNAEATTDNTAGLSDELMKAVAGNLSDYYVDNTDADFNDGYPIFYWQVIEEDILGDVISDGVLNTQDAVALQQYLLGICTLNEDQYHIADLTGDGAINGFDLAVLRTLLLEAI